MKWISIKDRLPDTWEYVLLYGTCDMEVEAFGIGRYDGKEFECYESYYTDVGPFAIDTKTITHWAELEHPESE